MFHYAGYIKRVIVHPAFLNASFKEVEKELAKMDLGEAIFRPSSKVRIIICSCIILTFNLNCMMVNIPCIPVLHYV